MNHVNNFLNISEIFNLYKVIFKGLGDGSMPPKYTTLGACPALARRISISCPEYEGVSGCYELRKYIREVIGPSWEFFSGLHYYPVPAPKGFKGLCANEAYCSLVYLWEGEYGDLRRAYCTYVAEELDKVTVEFVLNFNHQVTDQL